MRLTDPALLVGLLASTACSGGSTGLSYKDVPDSLVLADPNAFPGITDKCDGDLMPAGDVTLPVQRRTIHGFVCLEQVADATPVELWIDDATKQLVTLDDAKRSEAIAFKEVAGAIDPDLDARLQAAEPSDQVVAQVWVAVDESNVPTKDDVLLGAAKRASDNLEASIRSSLQVVFDAIASHNRTAKPGISILSDTNPSQWGVPRFHVKGTAEDIRWIGRLDIVTRILPEPGPGVVHTGAYYTIDNEAWLDNYSPAFDGTGLTAAVFDPDRWDSLWNLRGLPSGTCNPTSGNNSGVYKCYCGSVGASALDFHGRAVASIFRNAVLSEGADGLGGMADDVSLIDANANGSCSQDVTAGALNWATANGASVINQSFSLTDTGTGTPSNSLDLLDDYTAVHGPYPLIVAAAGNSGSSARVANNPRNCLVVGGADDGGQTNRTSVTMYQQSSRLNYSGPTNFEVPHLVAPAVNIDTGGDLAYEIETYTGTSVAAPQVAGMAVSLQEENANLVHRPELAMAGLIASADQDVDGTWPLHLDDNVDDWDGAGLVNALNAMFILSPSAAYPNGGNTAASYGHSYGTMSPSNFPAGTYYSAVWNASVPNFTRLRVASVFMGTVTCGSPPNSSNCSSESFPTVGIYIYDGATLKASILNASNNYQYITYWNSSGSTKNYTIKLYMSTWSGLTQAYYGLAWVAQ